MFPTGFLTLFCLIEPFAKVPSVMKEDVCCILVFVTISVWASSIALTSCQDLEIYEPKCLLSKIQLLCHAATLERRLLLYLRSLLRTAALTHCPLREVLRLRQTPVLGRTLHQ